MDISRWREVWFGDFESYNDSNFLPVPICFCAVELHSGRKIELWDDNGELGACPISFGPEILFTAFGASHEASCFLSLGWQFPENVLDLYCEYRRHTNVARAKGEQPPKSGYLAALEHFDLKTWVTPVYKEQMRRRCMKGPPYATEDRQEIPAYCWSDISPELVEAMPDPVWDEALGERGGRLVKACAIAHRIGMPADVEKLKTFLRKRTLVIGALISATGGDFQVYKGTSWSQKGFAALLKRENIPDWPQTTPQPNRKSERPFVPKDVLDAKVIPPWLDKYPQLKPLFELRSTVTKLSNWEPQLGADGRLRADLIPLVSVTGRTQPLTRHFIFGKAAFMRMMLQPPEGWGFIYADWIGAEVFIAAIKSGCPNMLASYRDDDPHLWFARKADLIPEGATPEEVKKLREKLKPLTFAGAYGGGVPAVMVNLRISATEARKLLLLREKIFAVYHRWRQEKVAEPALSDGIIRSDSGWQMRVPAATRAPLLFDWPMQTICADMMRTSFCEAIEAGLLVMASVHDALFVLSPLDRIEEDAAKLVEIMNAASRKWLDGNTCRIEPKIIRYPEHFIDDKGARMAAIVEQCLADLEGVEPSPPKPKVRKPKARILGDGHALHPYTRAVIENAEKRISQSGDPERDLFLGARTAVKFANGYCILDLEAVLKGLGEIAFEAGVEPKRIEAAIRSAKKTEEIAGVPTRIDRLSGALHAVDKIADSIDSNITKGLWYDD
jgi:hypothetical protein